MPCRDEPTEYELEASRRARTNEEIAKVVKPLQKRNDELTHENDMLRELVLKIATKDDMPASLWKKIQKTQVEHRKEDLRRLEVTFLTEITNWSKVLPPTVESYDMLDMFTNLLIKTRNADPELPLEPQLGFDPDKY